MKSDATYFEADRSAMASFLPPNYKRVLEIGCATGGFSKHLPLAAELWGVEPHHESADIAARHFTRVLTGQYEKVAESIPSSYFDLVICNDVIEHMPDHDAFLQQIRQKMASGAFIVGSLPNVRYITALAKLLLMKDWPYAASGILDRTHLRFFTERSIKVALNSNGFSVETVQGINSVLKSQLLHHGQRVPWATSFAVRIGTVGAIVGTLGYYQDIQYPQFGFCAKLA